MSYNWREKKIFSILQVATDIVKSILVKRKIKLTTSISKKKHPEDEMSKTLWQAPPLDKACG